MPIRLSPPLQSRTVEEGTWLQRLRCRLLGHDPHVVFPKAYCRRCPMTWGGGDPYP